MAKKLAIDGGEPIRKEPWPPRVQAGEDELNAITEIIRRSMAGPAKLWRHSRPSKTEELEAEFAKFFGVKHGVASTSGTASLHIAVASARLDVGNDVITSPLTDPGTLAAILLQNQVPVFADVDPGTLNMDPEFIAKCITDKTKAIVAVHLAGQPCDMKPIMELAEKYDLIVIEDCAQAHNAVYRGKKVGSIGDFGCFSLMTGKHITTGGEGGMTIMDDEEFWKNARSFADKGKTFWPDVRHFDHMGSNYRMTELQAAIGLVQLRKLPDIVSKRRGLCETLTKSISHLENVRPGKVIEGVEHAYWYYIIQVDLDSMKVGLDRISEALSKEGIPNDTIKFSGAPYPAPIYEYPFLAERRVYGNSKCPWSCPFYGREINYVNSCPNAKKALGETLQLFIHECCTEREVEDVVAALEKVEANYKR